MIDENELFQSAQTLVSDEQLADYFGVDIEEIREDKNYRLVKKARARTLVFMRNNLLAKAASGDQEALMLLNKQIFS